MPTHGIPGEADPSPAIAVPAASSGRGNVAGRPTAALPVRLGGIAGLLAVVLALGGGFLRGAWPSTFGSILSALPLLVLVAWVLAIRVSQGAALGRLGNMGAWAASLGLAGYGSLNVFAAVTPPGQLEGLLRATPLWLGVGLALCLLLWGTLALGTASLRAGVLPRASVVLWMIGVGTNVVTSWLPVSLVGLGGVAWSSVELLRSRTTLVSAKAVAPPVAQTAGRLVPLDALRGTIMALMAIDHASIFVRRWHPFEVWNQTLPFYPNLAAMLTRLATHPCAPGFFFLMGAGMLFFLEARRKAGWTDRKVLGHLALRGLLFIALEQLIVDVITSGRLTPLDFSILAGLGAAMLLGVPLLRLSGKVQGLIGAAIVLVMQFLPGWLLNADLGVLTPIRLLLLPGAVGPAYVLYPPIPWLGVALLGMAFARGLLLDPKRTYRLALVSGVACLLLFVPLRFLGGFGNLRMPAGHTLIDFFNLVKYPPSLTFLLLSLGFDLVLLAVFSRAAGWLSSRARPLIVLGQAALYFFVIHWLVYAVLGAVFFPVPGGLAATYLVWVIGLAALVPICWVYESFKHAMPVESVWRMI